MDNRVLNKIKDDLVILPRLLQNLNNMETTLEHTRNSRSQLLSAMQEEAKDVEAFKKETFFATLMKMLKKYEGKLEKEEKEYLQAKLDYDQVVEKVNILEEEHSALVKRIFKLQQEKETYQEEIKRRVNLLVSDLQGGQANRYRKLEQERNEWIWQLGEVKEAIAATRKVQGIITTVKEHLNKGKSWADYDIWGGGLLADIAKYDEIDQAKRGFNRLFESLKHLRKELEDIGQDIEIGDIGIDGTNRIFDFWVDNIFTDMSARNKIVGDISKVKKVEMKIKTLEEVLNKRKNNLEIHINDISY